MIRTKNPANAAPYVRTPHCTIEQAGKMGLHVPVKAAYNSSRSMMPHAVQQL